MLRLSLRNAFIAKYVGDFGWDYILIGGVYVRLLVGYPALGAGFRDSLKGFVE